MGNKAVVNTSTLNAIANAIIAKDSGSAMTPSQMATRIANIPTGSPILVNAWGVDASGVLTKRLTTFSLDSSVKDVSYFALNGICYFSNSDYSLLETADLSSLETISGMQSLASMFQDCKHLESVDFSSLTTISGEKSMQSTFSNCIALESISFPSLDTVTGNAAFYNTFNGCGILTTVDFSHVTTAPNTAFFNMFTNCTSLANVYFNAMTIATLMSDSTGNFPFSCPSTSCVFHCSDGTIEYINGTWTPVYN